MKKGKRARGGRGPIRERREDVDLGRSSFPGGTEKGVTKEGYKA